MELNNPLSPKYCGPMIHKKNVRFKKGRSNPRSAALESDTKLREVFFVKSSFMATNKYQRKPLAASPSKPIWTTDNTAHLMRKTYDEAADVCEAAVKRPRDLCRSAKK